MDSKEMKNLKLKESILNINMQITLKEAINIICNLYPKYCSYSLYNMLNDAAMFNVGNINLPMVNNTINLIALLKNIKFEEKRLGIIEGEELNSKHIKEKVSNLFTLLDININN